MDMTIPIRCVEAQTVLEGNTAISALSVTLDMEKELI
jgi:hypothetical protein